MRDIKEDVKILRRDHQLFFWGMVTVIGILLIATTVMAIRIPQYRGAARSLDAAMTETEKSTRDRILDSRAQRSQLAIALLQRELRLKALEENSIHLAVSLEDSTLSLRHGAATLREVPLTVGADSTIRSPDGRSWRLVRALGERHLTQKESNAELVVPEWVYYGRSEPVPTDAERRVQGGLGRYLLRLDDGTEIHTRPDVGPFATGSRPAAFIVESEEDMAAIFDAISIDTPVYIY